MSKRKKLGLKIRTVVPPVSCLFWQDSGVFRGFLYSPKGFHPPLLPHFGSKFWREKSPCARFFRCGCGQQPLFRTWQPSARAQADPPLDGVDMRSCRSACQVEGRGKTEMSMSGREVGPLQEFFFEFPQPFFAKKRKNDIKTYRMVGLFCDFWFYLFRASAPSSGGCCIEIPASPIQLSFF